MTIGKLRAKIRKLHEDHEEEEMENGELNLVPYLDIVTNVIMFLMMTTTFAAAMNDINVSAPTVGDASSGSSDNQKQDLNLTVSVSGAGFTIAASGGVLYQNDIPGKVPTIPKKGDVYDWPALTAKVKQIKDNFKDETKVIINANPEITYENIVLTMDSIRNEGSLALFPDVTLAAGVN